MRRLSLALVALSSAIVTGRAGAFDDVYGSGSPAQPRLQPAFRSDDFVESIGASTKLNQDFFDLNIRHYRAGLWDTDRGREKVPLRVAEMSDAWARYGVRPMLMVDSLRDTPQQTMSMLKEYPPGLVAELEGSNEVNNKFPPQVLNTRYKGLTDEAAAARWHEDFYKLLKADPQTRDIPLISFTAIFSDYRLAKPYSACDFGNMHSYQNSGEPSSSLEMNFTRFNNALPTGAVTKPFIPTECGYNVDADKSNGTGLTGSLSAQAKNIPMLMAEYYRHGIPREYLFAVYNTDGYGLVESDRHTKRPSYFAVKNLVAELSDSTWNVASKSWDGDAAFTPRALLFDLPGAPKTVHTLVLQKRSGVYELLIWNELVNYDSQRKADRNNAAVAVTLQFRTPINTKATKLTQNPSGNYDQTEVEVEGGTQLKLEVPSAVTILRLTPAAASALALTASKNPPTPAALSGESTETSVHLHWQASAGADGYFVFRNGWHLATVTNGDEYTDQSSWLRPGLGYTYQVEAFDAAGLTSPRAGVVVQTSAKFPDLVVTDFHAGGDLNRDKNVRLIAKLKNVGSGSTPPGIAISVSFSMDGKTVGWGGAKGPLKPGQEAVITSDGGGQRQGQWTPSRGPHLLSCVIDDINRLPGEFKGNNFAEKTIVVGTNDGAEILGATCCAPTAVNLTEEGTLDWIHFGLDGKDAVNRKAGANLLAASLTRHGDGYVDATAGCPVAMSWTDGDKLRQTHDTHAGLWWNKVGTSHTLTAPADTSERVLRVYAAGIEGAACTFTASLSDNSAPAFVSKWNGNASNEWSAIPDGFSAMYEVRYRAASAGQTLSVEWKLSAEPNRGRGQARLQAATLYTAKADK